MFGDKLTGATAKIHALVALITASGYTKITAATVADHKTAAEALPSVADYQAHLAAREQTAVEAATAPLATRIAALEIEAAAAAAYRRGLEEAGIKFTATFATAATAEGETPEAKTAAAAATNAAAVKTAIETAIATRSARAIATTGHPHALDVPPGDSPRSSSEAPTPSSKEEFHSHLRSIQDPGDRTAYFRKHKARFGL